MPSEARESLLVRIASLYYEHDYSQRQIADLLQISRSNISRLLKEAKQEGLVEIRIHKRIATVPTLEREFMVRFGIKHAMVVDSKGMSSDEALTAAGQLAAGYLSDILQPHDVLAIAWGSGVSAAVTALSPCESLDVDVVQMIGTVGTVASPIDSPELARQLAGKLGGRYYYLHAPLFVDSRTVRDMFLEQPTISDTVSRAHKATVALVGIGTTEEGASSFLRARHLTEEQVSELRANGAVGETCGQYFDIEGRTDFDLNNRVIALSLADLKNIPNVIAVARGLPKCRSILGALRGNYVNVLATDDITAEAVFQQDAKAEARQRATR